MCSPLGLVMITKRWTVTPFIPLSFVLRLVSSVLCPLSFVRRRGNRCAADRRPAQRTTKDQGPRTKKSALRLVEQGGDLLAGGGGLEGADEVVVAQAAGDVF